MPIFWEKAWAKIHTAQKLKNTVIAFRKIKNHLPIIPFIKKNKILLFIYLRFKFYFHLLMIVLKIPKARNKI